MNTGTKIRTALRIAVSLNTAIYAVSAAVGALGFGWLTMAWAIFTIISDFAVSALTTYFNHTDNFTVTVTGNRADGGVGGGGAPGGDGCAIFIYKKRA